MTVSYGQWHTLTVSPNPDHVGYPDGPAFVDTLEHPQGCRTVEFRTIEGDDWFCPLGEMVDEFTGIGRDIIGLPTEPGQYRIRGWWHDGYAPMYEPDSGVECEPLTEPAERMA